MSKKRIDSIRDVEWWKGEGFVRIYDVSAVLLDPPLLLNKDRLYHI